VLTGGGQATVKLKITKRYAGDNYQIQAGLGDFIHGENGWYPHIKAVGPILTAWKRAYVERDHMFKNGGLLYSGDPVDQTIPSGIASLKIAKGPGDAVLDSLQPGDKIAIFDASRPFEGEHDVAFIGSAIDRETSVDYAIVPLVIARNSNVPYATRYAYQAAYTSNATHLPNFLLGSGAAVGVLERGGTACGLIPDHSPTSCFYVADTSQLWPVFSEADIEIVTPREGNGAIPYLHNNAIIYDPTSNALSVRLAYFSRLWSSKFEVDPQNPANSKRKNNFHLMAAAGQDNFVGDGGELRRNYALTVASYDYTFMLTSNIADLVAENGGGLKDITALVQEDIAHEFAHQFRINACTDEDSGHAAGSAWCELFNHCGSGQNRTISSLMYDDDPDYYLQRIDGIAHFSPVEYLNPNGLVCPAGNPGDTKDLRGHSDPE
jgi:hypothetical protein